MILYSRTVSDRQRMLALTLSALLMFCVTSCAKRSHPTLIAEPPASIAQSQTSNTSALQRVNINSAPAKELEMLPGIGKVLAERIVEHREKYGPFRRAEHLMMVRGISETRFRAMRHLVTVE